MAVSAVLAVSAGPAVHTSTRARDSRRRLVAAGWAGALLATGAVQAQAPAFPAKADADVLAARRCAGQSAGASTIVFPKLMARRHPALPLERL